MTDFWISNASPLITLTAVGRLDLFAALKCEIRVPLAVLEELRAGAAEDRADEAVRKAGKFVIVEDVAIPTNVDRWGLDPGEAQVVSQALTTGAKGVILDDLAGRRCAQSLGLSVIGTIGLIARATKLGIVPQAAPIISAVREAGLYLSETLVSAVLAELGEA